MKKNFEYDGETLIVTNQDKTKHSVLIDPADYESYVKKAEKVSVKKKILYTYPDGGAKYRVDHAITAKLKRLYPHERPAIRFKNGNSLDIRRANLIHYATQRIM